MVNTPPFIMGGFIPFQVQHMERSTTLFNFPHLFFFHIPIEITSKDIYASGILAKELSSLLQNGGYFEVRVMVYIQDRIVC